MQTQLTLLALAASSIAMPASTVKHTANGAATYAVQPSKDDISELCIQLTAVHGDKWYNANTGVWGSATGSIDSAGGQVCVPANSGPGGAMYIGSSPNPGAGNTKLECFFPTRGEANCDVSLVDGYSLSVTCTADGASATIGGATNFLKARDCPDKSEKSAGVCKNDQGYDASQSDVGAFFQQTVNNGNNYCIWMDCGQDYSFPTENQVSCHVTGGNGGD